MNIKVDFKKLPGQVTGILIWAANLAVTIALALLIVASLAAIYGYPIPRIPVLAKDYQGLSWLLIGGAAWRHMGRLL